MNLTLSLPVDSSIHHVLFIVQPAFSLLAFSAAADALTTANLVAEVPCFSFSTLTISGFPATSDIGLTIGTDYKFDASSCALRSSDGQSVTQLSANIVIVCGGYRCSLDENDMLSDLLRLADNSEIAIGGLWNGSVSLAHAGLMDGYATALHPGNHAAAKSRFPTLDIRSETVVFDRRRLTAAGPNSSFDLMLMVIQRHKGSDTVTAIRKILRADTGNLGEPGSMTSIIAQRKLPSRLENAIELMRNNLDARLSPAVIASHINLSTRAMERLFQKHLNTSPGRHYLELRLNRARELLQQSDTSIGDISEACGFVSGAHFSRAYAKRFGCTPSAVRISIRPLLDL